MSLFTKVEKRDVIGLYDPVVAMFNQRRGYGASGQTVDSERAMRHMAVWRCKHLLADIVAGLPIDQFRWNGNERKRMTPSEFVRQPSDMIEPDEWKYALMLSALDCGNGFAYVTKIDASGRTLRAEIVPHEEVTVTQKSGFLSPPEYKISSKIVDPDRVLHFRAFGPKPGSVMGMNPIQAMGPTVALGLAVRDFGASWYNSGGHPTTLLSTTQDITDTQATSAKEAFRAATTGDHIAVLGNAWDIRTVQQNPSDALFLNATNATTIDICGYYGVPPEFLGYAATGSSLTYSNREQRILDLLTMTVGWWVGRMERLISRQIPQPQFVKLNVDALLRSDALTRWRIHDLAVRVGARNNDEVRHIEDEESIPNGQGEQYLWPPSGVKTLVDDAGELVSATPDTQGGVTP